MKAYERFLNYVSYDTTSDEDTGRMLPSTECQRVLAQVLADEMTEMGMSSVTLTDNCYVYGFVPATKGFESEPAIGLIAHMDTSKACSGKDIRPRFVENYDGGDIVLNRAEDVVMKVKDFPYLPKFAGKTLIVTDGTTLLGGDDKAGIAEIMAACERFLSSDLPHGKICVAFTPDEEIGEGASGFDVPFFGADFAYTVDGGDLGEVEYETFNAAGAKIIVHGRSIHPGTSKNKMKNALLMAMELHHMLPVFENPMYTEGREGFYHLNFMTGHEETAELRYIIRDHDRSIFEDKKSRMMKIVDYLNDKYGDGSFELHMEDQYYNMGDVLINRMDIVDKARDAFVAMGVEPVTIPVRGGTDGARLTYMGLPCPNLSSCSMNCHGKYEFCCLEDIETMTDVLVELIRVKAA